MAAPDFLVVGHIVQDLVAGGGWRLGGAVSYASLLARKFGLQTAALTSCADDLLLGELLPGVDVRVVPSETTTQMRNEYDAGGRRSQQAPQRARRILARDVPAEWRDSRIVLLGPVAGEIEGTMAATFGEKSLIGIGAQGWLRDIGDDGRVRQVPPHEWEAGPLLEHGNAVFVSDEDIPADQNASRPAVLDDWADVAEVLAFTRGYAGADVAFLGEWRHIAAVAADPVDFTGAGDIFAAAFLIRYAEGGDAWESARFAAAASSLVIEGEGVEGVPDRAAVEGRLAGAREPKT